MNPEIVLRANVNLAEAPTPPTAPVVIDTLLRMAHGMTDTAFSWCFIDKPRAGTVSLIYNDPARPWPTDGIRYAQSTESRNLTTQTINNPASPTGQPLELETYVVTQGIYPPSSTSVPLPLDTPELNIARFRMRFRISSGGQNQIGNPNLWFVYWGRDDRMQTRAPPGWEREVIRRYPLPTVAEPFVYPLRRPGPPNGQPQQQQQPQQSPPQQPGQQPMTHAQVQQLQQRQQSHMQSPPPQPGMQAQNRPRSGVPAPGMRPPFQQQQPQATPPQTYAQPQLLPSPAAAGRRSATPAGHGQAMPPAQQLEQQQRMQQQQQKQQAAAQAAQAQAAQAAQAQQLARMRLLSSTVTFPAPFSDPYEYLSERSWAGLRYEKNHALIAPIFDALTVDDVLTSWKAPALPSVADLKAQIAIAEAEVADLRTKSSEAAAATAGGLGASAVKAPNLLAPLPHVMSIADMTEGAMQAFNMRKAAREQEAALRAEEEERIKREREAEEAAQRTVLDQKQQQDAKQQNGQQLAEVTNQGYAEQATDQEPSTEERNGGLFDDEDEYLFGNGMDYGNGNGSGDGLMLEESMFDEYMALCS